MSGARLAEFGPSSQAPAVTGEPPVVNTQQAPSVSLALITGRPVTVSAGVAAPQTIRLSGSILGLTPDEALAAVAASTDLAIRRFADHIELQPPAARP